MVGPDPGDVRTGLQLVGPALAYEEDDGKRELAPFRPFSAAEAEAVLAAAGRFGAFLQLPIEIELA